MPSLERLTISLDEGFPAKLKLIAKRESRSEAWVVRKAVEIYINKNYVSTASGQLKLDKDNE